MTQRRKKNRDILNIIRYVILAVLVLYIGILLAYKGGSSASFKEVSQAVREAADISGMTKGSERELKRYYKLNAKDFEDVMLYYTNQTMGVEELLLVKAKSEADVRMVEDAVKERLDIQINNFEGYGAGQVKLLKSAVWKIRGNYVFFVVSPNAQKFEKAFTKSL
ncbi:DUF4358 domain-containing protein [Bariatricus massiliensis]|uniref:DUF4358 domain-containing protein n=1 Tax=Bariatricus massiliensis TaxID=1745713 RepID=A0ABS8DEP7_9FIRM|nr:DUF4358 domain-containing protein [Bariatricus massiliensis]MCB7302696.1 DUF4358 domain-containing protein [Bariatricus massiliensis]MCB7373912.1 DUF4358 domain-containing protein [Bariatricus massiliensis]MCB7386582.1 DUF4358 domain-containing protein [Bariatricus massiliensis]MCB7410744.1 DUF4358 domain-containing protein [Bariatricus massiliensis]MCQ5253417.1 DUF4358 domain-containing protein [Bariatricus massiliensis]